MADSKTRLGVDDGVVDSGPVSSTAPASYVGIIPEKGNEDQHTYIHNTTVSIVY